MMMMESDEDGVGQVDVGPGLFQSFKRVTS